MHPTRIHLRVLAAACLVLALSSCDVSDIVGDCQIVTDTFSSTYGPNEQRSHTFRVGCAGTLSIFWRCPQCPDPNAGRLILLDPVGNEVLSIDGAGFGGTSRQVSTLLEGQWTILIRGTGGGVVNSYNIDVTYPGL